MSKIYIVTDWEYSDYSVNAVFTDEKLAREYVFYKGGDVEEWEANEPLKIKKGYWPYQVTYDVLRDSYDATQLMYDDFYVERCEKKEVQRRIYIKLGTWFADMQGNFTKEDDQKVNSEWEFYFYAKDNNHAAKIAGEKVAHLKALNLINCSREDWDKIKDGTFD